MADYAKLEIRGIYSKSSDYSSPKADFNPAIYALTPDEYFHCEIQADTSAGTTLTTSILSSATLLIVKNNDAANYVTATFDCAGADGTKVSYGQAGDAKKGGPRVKPGTPKAKAYCARSLGIKKRLSKKKQNDPNTANNLSRKRWKC